MRTIVLFFISTLAMFTAYARVGDEEFAPKSKWVKAKWAGGDIVKTGGGNGQVSLEQGDRGRAFLKVQCNSKWGYSITFHTPNAADNTTSKMLLNGVGGQVQEEIEYTAEMHCNQFRDTCTIMTEELDLTGASPSVSVHFFFDGVLPDTTWNVTKLFLEITPFAPFAKEAGDYIDTITAEITLN